MSYIALYRKWRPLVFEDVVEQEHVVRTLKNSVEAGRIAHAYLFCGTRGTGKTTMAKIFSRAINCLRPNDGDPCNQCEICSGILSGSILDVVEIDAASNNSVDNIRQIRDEVIYAPSQARYKVYIIDEVHMLSTGAFNALLKTLEEPPEHVVFILATTEPHKLPATILSRCQRFDFRRISIESIMDRLEKIALASGVSVQADALRLVAKLSDGALRDAISILDQCIAMGGRELTYNDVLGVVGIVNDTFIADVVDALASKDTGRILEQIDMLVMGGKDISQFMSDLVYYFRNLLICKLTDKPWEVIEAQRDLIDRMKGQCLDFEREHLFYTIKELSSAESGLKWSTHPRVMLEVTLIKLCEQNFNVDKDDFMGRLDALERKISNADFSVKPEVKNIPDQGQIKQNAGTEKKVLQKPEVKAAADVKIKGQEIKTIPQWDAILSELRDSGRVMLYTNLIGTKAVELDGVFIGILFGEGSGFKKMLVSKAEHLEVLENMIGKKLGREVRVKCLDENEFKEKQPEEKDEFVEKAKDIAKKLNAPLNIIDE